MIRSSASVCWLFLLFLLVRILNAQAAYSAASSLWLTDVELFDSFTVQEGYDVSAVVHWRNLSAIAGSASTGTWGGCTLVAELIDYTSDLILDRMWAYVTKTDGKKLFLLSQDDNRTLELIVRTYVEVESVSPTTGQRFYTPVLTSTKSVQYSDEDPADGKGGSNSDNNKSGSRNPVDVTKARSVLRGVAVLAGVLSCFLLGFVIYIIYRRIDRLRRMSSRPRNPATEKLNAEMAMMASPSSFTVSLTSPGAQTQATPKLEFTKIEAGNARQSLVS
eukprot:TRINITY_DN5736_c0_g1_i1.p1 TRINITY_DN5736_c0_g1~~TRINITY_DN5736_c0_g1_i1.p1  ORF type:complete len:276 (+),score=59.45 TRINITY_DN5736_c0_g1_i1:224-1051(+)